MKGKRTAALTWEDAPDILTVEEAAALVRISRNSAYLAIQSGALPAANFGQRRIRVSKAVLGQVFGMATPDRPATAALNHGEA